MVRRQIASKLDAFTLSEIGAPTGLSLAACSRFVKVSGAASQALGSLVRPFESTLDQAGRTLLSWGFLLCGTKGASTGVAIRILKGLP
jgi:hypothetical protein